jgi:DNA primase
MNCKQFNNIPLEEVLLSLGHLPTKQNEKETWYLNPFANESQASFKVDKRINLWFLHSEGLGGNNTDFIQKYFSYSVKEVLNWASAQNFSSFQKQIQTLFDKTKSIKPDYQIDEIKELQNTHLKNYLHERSLSSDIYPYVKEIHFIMDDKKLYAIGFENISGGFELRNSFYKGAILSKDISILYPEAKKRYSCNINSNLQNIQSRINANVANKKVAVFEGFMDALSFMELQKIFTGDLLVLNSTSLLKKAIEQLKSYSEIYLFLDNDKAGKKCKAELQESFPQAKDHSSLYSQHKDLNDFLIYKMAMKANMAAGKTEINTEISRREPRSQVESSEFIQRQSKNIQKLQELVPDEKKLKENAKQENRNHPEQENTQSYRRRR